MLECLLPDACTSCDDPLMQRGLEPLDRFDHPQLRCAPGARRPTAAYAALRRFIAKECAGLALDYRPDTDALRDAFRTGEFTRRHVVALEWAFSGMRRMYVFPGFIAGTQLPIYEVARCFWTAFDGIAFGCGPWLNQWADDPSRPHPSRQRGDLVRFPHDTSA